MSGETIDEQVAGAYRAAGRAVAASLRGWREGSTTSAQADPWPSAPLSARPFIAYAGLWSAARRRGGLDGIDEADDAHLAEAMCEQPSDATAVGEAQWEIASLLRTAGAGDAWGWIPGVSAAWRAELEQMWPVIQHVAVLLLAGRTVSATRVRSLADDRISAGLAV